MPYPIYDMIFYFFFYSFCGWLLETAVCSIDQRRFVNRGFLNGPFCPIYGCAVWLIFLLLVPVRDSLDSTATAVTVIFLSSALIATIVEYAVSLLMEKLFRARWWDYSHMKFNINGRVNIGISLIWGGLATLLIYLIQPLTEKLASRLQSALPTTDLVLIILFSFDIIVSVIIARRIGNKLEQLDKWDRLIHDFKQSVELTTREEILGRIERLTEKNGRRKSSETSKNIPIPELSSLPLDTLRRRIYDYVNELYAKSVRLMTSTRFLQQRMLRAFPYMKWPGRPAIMRRLKEHLRIKRGKDKD